jgi:hypothetical protein
MSGPLERNTDLKVLKRFARQRRQMTLQFKLNCSKRRKSIEKGLISPEYLVSGQGILGRAATYSIAFLAYHQIGYSVANRHLAAHLAARVGPAQRNT